MSSTARLRRGYMRHRRRHVLLLLVLGAAMGLTVTGVAALTAGMDAALERGTTLDVAGQDYQLTPKSEAAATALASLGAVQVAQTPAVLRADAAAVPVTLTSSTTDPARLLVVTDGASPTQSNEVIVTEAAAKALGLRVGSRADVIDGGGGDIRPVIVSGLGADPRDVNRMAVATADQFDPAQVTGWAASNSFASSPEVANLGQQGGFFLRSVQSITEESQRSLPTLARYSAWTLASLTAAWVIGGATLLTSLRRAYREDVTSLQQSGHRAPGGFFAGLVACLLSAGVAFGAALAVAVAWGLSAPISKALGQRWVDFALPAPGSWATLVAIATAPFVLIAVMDAARRTEIIQRRGSWVVILVAAGVLVAAQMVGATGPTFWLLTVAAVAFAALCWVALRRIGTPASITSRLRAHISKHLISTSVGLGAAALVLTGTVAGLSGGVAYATKSFVKTQPSGSLFAEGLTQAAADSIATQYVRAGGVPALTYELPDESKSSLRVFHPALEQCMRKHHLDSPLETPPNCDPSGSPVPVNAVALVDDSSAPEVAADPRLLSAGAVAIARPGAEGQPWTATRMLPATPDARLGGSLPGLLVRAGSPTAAQLGLAGAGTFGTVLPQATSLEPRAFAAVYGALNSAAGTGVLLEEGFDDGGEAVMAVGLLLIGGLVIIVLMAANIRSFVDGHARTRAALSASGGNPSVIRSIFAIPIVQMGAVIGAGALLGWGIAVLRSPASPGWVWLLTPVAAAACCALGLLWNRNTNSWGPS